MSPSIVEVTITLIMWERVRRQPLGLNMYVCEFFVVIVLFWFFFDWATFGTFMRYSNKDGKWAGGYILFCFHRSYCQELADAVNIGLRKYPCLFSHSIHEQQGYFLEILSIAELYCATSAVYKYICLYVCLNIYIYKHNI